MTSLLSVKHYQLIYPTMKMSFVMTKISFLMLKNLKVMKASTWILKMTGQLMVLLILVVLT
ncbi:hypothetical protein AHAS_Ahas09G0156500 [Arachis hypogaea]